MFGFLLSSITISLTGVMGPGPMTAATLAAGARHRHAGLTIALGHAVIEFPLMILIVAGLGKVFQIDGVKIAIGMAGGFLILLMAMQMLKDARNPVNLATTETRRSAFITGILLTAGNPYFLLWWATIGLALAMQAIQFGLLAFTLFAITHWLCDLVWLEVLSHASFKGSRVFSEKSQRVVLQICGAALFFFAGKFLIDAILTLAYRTH